MFAGVGAGGPTKTTNTSHFPATLANGDSSHVITSQSPDQPTSTSAPSNDEENLANTKEKTPMCLINELARFNRVSTHHEDIAVAITIKLCICVCQIIVYCITLIWYLDNL